MSTWTPGSRKAQLELETPFDGVPEHLWAPLTTWMEVRLRSYEALTKFGIGMRLPFPETASHSGRTRAMNLVYSHCQVKDDNFLNIIEYLLAHHCAEGLEDPDWQAAEELDAILAAGNSAYRVNERDDGLAMRILPAVQEQVQSVVSGASGSTADHLAKAWNLAYARTADPVKSYSESIKAAEAALAPHVSPENPKQTLGTMLRDIKAKPAKWEFEIGGDVGVVVSLASTLWEGQTSRHGGLGETRHETVAEAQAAVHLAATLVQHGVSGAFRKASR